MIALYNLPTKPNAKQGAILTALKAMNETGRFSICTVRDALKLCHKKLCPKTEAMFSLIHCAPFSSIYPATLEAVNQCFADCLKACS